MNKCQSTHNLNTDLHLHRLQFKNKPACIHTLKIKFDECLRVSHYEYNL